MPRPHRRTGELRSDDPEEEKKQRAFTACINKLTVDNYDRIFLQMRDIEVTSVKTLRGFVDQIFNKALAETIFCEMYSRLCHDLHEILPQCALPLPLLATCPVHSWRCRVRSECVSYCVRRACSFEDLQGTGNKLSFRKVVVTKCQEEFESGAQARMLADEREAAEKAPAEPEAPKEEAKEEVEEGEVVEGALPRAFELERPRFVGVPSAAARRVQSRSRCGARRRRCTTRSSRRGGARWATCSSWGTSTAAP